MLPDMYDVYLQDLLLDLPDTTLLVLTFKDLEVLRAFKDFLIEGEWRFPTVDVFWEVTRGIYVGQNKRPIFTHAERFVRNVYPHLKRLVIVPPDDAPFIYTEEVGRRYFAEEIQPRILKNEGPETDPS